MSQSKEILLIQIAEILKRHDINNQFLLEELNEAVNDSFKQDKNAVKPSDIKKKLDLFLISKKIEGLSEKTLYEYKLQLEHFAEKVNVPVSKITTDDIRMYMSYLAEERKIKDATLLTYTRACLINPSDCAI